MHPLPDISVIVVTWNGRQHLESCLGAIEAQRDVRAEIILVDNASTDGTADFVGTRFPSVRVVSLPENRGFAGGNNAGARAARAPILAFLNNDTAADPGWLRALVNGLDPGGGFALATSKIVYMHDPDVIDSAGDGVFRWGGAFKRHHGEAAATATQSQEVFGVCGGAFAVTRAVFEELGGFDEDFFASHEDVDLSYRARLRGFRCRYVADAVVRHHGSSTLGKVSRFAVFHGQRNLEWVFVKNTPGSLLVRTLPGHVLYDLAAAAHFARLGLLGTFVAAKMAALRAMPVVLHKRARIQAMRTVDASAIDQHLDKRWLAAKVREKQFDVGLAEGAR